MFKRTQETNDENDTNRSDDGIVAVNDKTLEYICTTNTQEKNFFIISKFLKRFGLSGKIC